VAQPLTERRAYSRFGAPATERLQAVLRPGHVVAVVNLSAGGALIDGHRPLRPGSRVFLQITVGDQAGGRVARVVRSAVASLQGTTGVRYRTAIHFDERWDSIWERCTLDGYQPEVPEEFEVIDGHDLPEARDPAAAAIGDGRQ
jgi:hypothetical protein